MPGGFPICPHILRARSLLHMGGPFICLSESQAVHALHAGAMSSVTVPQVAMQPGSIRKLFCWLTPQPVIRHMTPNRCCWGHLGLWPPYQQVLWFLKLPLHLSAGPSVDRDKQHVKEKKEKPNRAVGSGFGFWGLGPQAGAFRRSSNNIIFGLVKSYISICIGANYCLIC